MAAGESATKTAYKTVDPRAPVVPTRLREPLYDVTDEFMPEAFAANLGGWLHQNRDRFVRGGDPEGKQRFNFELLNVDDYAPAELFAPFKKALIEKASEPDVLEALCVPEFDLRLVETHATLYHHGSHFDWHDDAPSPEGQLVESRRITFCYYMHAEPAMFAEGELEFLNGETVAPKNNRLVLFHPLQQHRVRRVECWSAHFLHGRWALTGWLHGDAPDGWLERVPQLRGRPNNQH